MKVVFLFLALFVDLVVASASWKDEIPAAEDLLESVVLSKAVFEVSNNEQLRQLDIFDTIFFKETVADTEVAVVRSDYTRSIIVGFRGTNVEELADIAANANVLQTNFYGMGKVHRGFKQKLEQEDLHLTIRNGINRELEEYSDYNIIVTGHSQGAALATLFGAWIVGTNQLDTPKRVTAFPFGSPRVGNGDFRRSVRDLRNFAVHRIVKEEDVVCRLPGSLVNYRHVGHLIMADLNRLDAHAYWEQGGDGEKYASVDKKDWDLSMDWKDIRDWRTDHAINDYVAVVELAIEGTIGWPTKFEPMAEKEECPWWKIWC